MNTQAAVALSLFAFASVVAPTPRALADDEIWTEKNHPSTCPYTEGDAEALRAAGFVSWGGFEFGVTDTTAVDELLPTLDIRWLETEHFEIGFALGPYKVAIDEKKKIRAELTELATKLPGIKPKSKQLDPWLRTYLFGQRLEAAYARMLQILDVAQDEFPDGKTRWILGGGKKYMGEGPHLGMGGKFEVLIVPNEVAHVDFLRAHYGLQVRKPQRYNTIERDSLILSFPAVGSTRVDTALHGAVIFNQAINFLDGYKHYSYELPIWLREGLAHLMEREISPDYNSFDSSEGAIAEMTKKSDWDKETAKMIRAGEAPTLATLVNLRTYAELELPHHFATWSMTKFMIEQHGAAYAQLLDLLKGIKNEQGLPDGANMPDKQRKAFQEAFGISYRDFDQLWSEWALSQ
ncbi:MAG: hypothetical protein WD226_11590 [Planctomycetota bacterium]